MSRVNYISPYRADKNIGRAINEAVRSVKAEPEDWFVNTDHDVLFLQPDTKLHIEQILAETEFDVLGCKTNRVGVLPQLVGGSFCERDDVKYHMDMAKLLWQRDEKSVLATAGPIAAFLLCFKQSTWSTLGGFDEGCLNFDTLFSERARRMGFNTGIMQGVYIFHLYRFNSKNPRKDIAHLL
jgi:hypothetical protein